MIAIRNVEGMEGYVATLMLYVATNKRRKIKVGRDFKDSSKRIAAIAQSVLMDAAIGTYQSIRYCLKHQDEYAYELSDLAPDGIIALQAARTQLGGSSKAATIDTYLRNIQVEVNKHPDQYSELSKLLEHSGQNPDLSELCLGKFPTN